MEKMIRRKSLDLIYEMLKHTKTPIKRTTLQNDMRMPSKRFGPLLTSLVEWGFIDEIPFVEFNSRGIRRRQNRKTKYIYGLSDRGKVLLSMFEEESKSVG